MAETPNHEYNVPSEGQQNWHVPLNENFQQYDTDIEIRDAAGNRGNYQPKDGAKFLATDIGVVFVGDGTQWIPSFVSPEYDPADNGSVSLSIDGTRVLSLGGESGGDSGNVVAGHSSNSVESDVVGATIAGGGFDKDSISQPNVASADYGVVAGGYGNKATGEVATVSGGEGNEASGEAATVSGGGANDASGGDSTVGGGFGNAASGVTSTVSGGESNTASGEVATVGGGLSNEASGEEATVGGGFSNAAGNLRSTVGGGSGNEARGGGSTIGGGINSVASGGNSAIGGGSSNEASGGDSTIGGGGSNLATAGGSTVGGGTGNEASGVRSTVGGGGSNVASGENATVPGGSSNEAQSAYSFAAGRTATAAAPGAFVWGDSSDQNVTSNQTDEFKIQAGGGAILYSSSDLSQGVNLAPGDGSWSSVSTRTAKTSISPTEPEAVLESVEDLEVSTWEYDSAQDATHMGPMAEDFHDAFGLGADRECIANVDADGVALAAIQGLSKRLEQRDERIDELSEEKEALSAENDRLRDRLDALEDRVTDIEAEQTESPMAQD